MHMLKLTGTGLQVTAITHTNSTGVATVTTSPAHGLRPNNIIFLGGAADNFWNKQYVVTQVVDLTTLLLIQVLQHLHHQLVLD